MPAFDQDPLMDAYNTGGIAYSGVRPSELGSTEYTLVTLVVDISGSVSGFQDALLQSIKESVKSCGYSPRANNLLVRVVYFGSTVKEVHGFKELQQINTDTDYVFVPSGMTALFDAVVDAVEATRDYGEMLFKNDFDVNAIIIVATDGEDNNSKRGNTVATVQKAIKTVTEKEQVESLITLLVGINAASCKKYLQNVKDQGGFDEYIDVENFDYKVGAKLAKFVSKSVSSQSQALGTGGPSQVLTF